MSNSQSFKDNQEVFNFLNANPIAVLSTVNLEGDPHATTIYFKIDEEFNCYFLSKKDTAKIQNIKNNKNVVLVVFEPTKQINVQIYAKAVEVTNEESSGSIFKQILEVTRQTSISEVPPVSKLFAGHYVAYKLVPKKIDYSVYQPDPDLKAKFYSIDF